MQREIVLENLSRYRMSLDRSRFENRQLMEWSHRAVLLKLQDMAKVFGIQIFTVDARFSTAVTLGGSQSFGVTE